MCNKSLGGYLLGLNLFWNAKQTVEKFDLYELTERKFVH